MYVRKGVYIFIFICISKLEREKERERDFGAEGARKTSHFQNNFDLQTPHKKNLLWFVALLLDFLCIEEVKNETPNTLINGLSK